MIIKNVDIECREAEALIDELSEELFKITGNSGRESFNKEDMKNSRAVFAVAFENGDAVGCGGIREVSSDTAEIKRIYSKQRMKGIGRNIIEYLESKAKELGYSHLLLETRKANENAICFYKRIGYDICQNYGRYKNVDEAVCFTKKLY